MMMEWPKRSGKWYHMGEIHYTWWSQSMLYCFGVPPLW